MAKKKSRVHQDKIYTGAYVYLKNDTQYCEETFEVFYDPREFTTSFVTQILSRVSTGELLKLNIDYNLNKDWIPYHVTIQKDLGNESITETFIFDSIKNIIKYSFKKKDKKITKEIPATARFHIATPATCTSMIFILSKKFEQTSKNIYTTFHSPNKWEYDAVPYSKSIALEKVSLLSEKIEIHKNELDAVEYKLFENNHEDGTQEVLQVFLSKHLSMPYLLYSEDGSKVEVRYLNDLSEDKPKF
jgi:hypothetical protein